MVEAKMFDCYYIDRIFLIWGNNLNFYLSSNILLVAAFGYVLHQAISSVDEI